MKARNDELDFARGLLIALAPWRSVLRSGSQSSLCGMGGDDRWVR
jgi:hypothetical protein